MATATEGFVGGVLATLAAIFVVPKVIRGRVVVVETKPTPKQVNDFSADRGYYVLQWFGPARGRPDVLAGPWSTKSAAQRADQKYKAVARRQREPLSTRIRHFDSRTAARNAEP